MNLINLFCFYIRLECMNNAVYVIRQCFYMYVDFLEMYSFKSFNNYQIRCKKAIKCSISLAFYRFSPARLINSTRGPEGPETLPDLINYV